MYLETPVIAVNSGGPTETIIDNETGFLCQQVFQKIMFIDYYSCFKSSFNKNADDFAKAMLKLTDKNLSDCMGKKAKKHVEVIN
jgi:glycosyltransferase involved in cell wall biosynthesis